MSQNYAVKRTQVLVLISLLTALITSVTLFTSIQFTAGGYFNLGDVAVMLIAAFAPFRVATIPAVLGNVLADLLNGAFHYAVFTGVIKLVEVLIVFSFRKMLKTKFFFIPFTLGALFMVVAYGLVDSLIIGGYSFYASVIANAPQGIMAAILSSLGYPLVMKLDKYFKGQEK